MPGFFGFVALGSQFKGVIVTRTDAAVPTDSTGLPAYRVYGSALMANGTGSLALKDSGNVTGATNASPIVIASAGHGLSTGTRVTVASVGGNTAANGTFQITAVDSNSFSLDGSTGNGSYTSGGSWHVSGLYDFTFTPTGGNGFVQDQTYTVLVTATVSSVVKADTYTFTVV